VIAVVFVLNYFLDESINFGLYQDKDWAVSLLGDSPIFEVVLVQMINYFVE